MFITLTIDTHQKFLGRKIRFSKKKVNIARDWKRQIKVRKRSLWQRVLSWRQTIKNGHYKFNNQVAAI